MKFPTQKPSFLREKCAAKFCIRVEPARLQAWREAAPGKSLSDAIKQACDAAFLRSPK